MKGAGVPSCDCIWQEWLTKFKLVNSQLDTRDDNLTKGTKCVFTLLFVNVVNFLKIFFFILKF